MKHNAACRLLFTTEINNDGIKVVGATIRSSDIKNRMFKKTLKRRKKFFQSNCCYVNKRQKALKSAVPIQSC